MDQNTPTLKVVNPDQPLTDQARAEIAALAVRQRKAGGVLMKAINFVGNQVEDGMKLLPEGFRKQVDNIAKAALEQSFNVAKASRGGPLGKVSSSRSHKLAAAVSGAVGGFGGLPTALAEIPVTTTVIFRSVLSIAAEYGEDPESEVTRMECLRVFGAGNIGADDDGVDTAFFGARLSISGPAVHGLINKVAPKFGAVITQKLASQAVPVIGAAAGAGTNLAFVSYYTELAHVHFALRQLARLYDDQQVIEEFHKHLGRKVPTA